MVRLLLSLLGILVINCASISQIDTLKKSRFDFAHTTIGIGLNYSNAGTLNYIDAQTQVQHFNLENQFYPVLYFGGLHFWNSMELYFAFPLGRLVPKKPTSRIKINNSLSSVFGIKYYPWKINNNTFRPFLGGSLSGLNYQQKSKDEDKIGALRTKIIYPLQGGFSWRKDKWLIDFQVIYNYDNHFEYYISQNQSASINTPKIYYSTALKILLEGTKSSERYYYSGEEKKDYHILKEKKLLNSFYIGIGPSTSFFTQKSDYNANVNPFFHSPTNSDVYLDIGLGYYYEPLEAFAGIAYRNIKSESKVYSNEQNISRASLTFEFNKFLFDYHGFVPYLGIGISNEQLKYSESVRGSTHISTEANEWKPIFVFGWDILPTRLEYMTLRTNIRYTPKLTIELNDYLIPYSQLEFNIIQFVFYPQRFLNLRKNNF